MKAQGGVKIPLFSGIFNFRTQYLGNEIFYSITSKSCFHPHGQENRFHLFLKLFDRCTKTTPPGEPPPTIFVFNPQTSLRDLPGSKKPHFKGI